MFNNIFCEMDIIKRYPLGGGGGNGGTVLISSWKCTYSIYLDIKVYYLDIQAISTLLCLLLILDLYSTCFYNTCLYKPPPPPEKSSFRSLQSLLLPQFSNYRHRTGYIVKRNLACITNYLRISINRCTNF